MTEEGPTHRYSDGRSVALNVGWVTPEHHLMLVYMDIVQDTLNNARYETHLIPLPFSLLREALASSGWALVQIPKDREEPKSTEAVLTRFVAHLLRDLKEARKQREEAELLAQKEHKRADENFLDLRSDVARNRADVRETIVDYLKHVSQLTVGSPILSEDARDVVGTVAHWIQNELDVVWANEQEGRGPKTQ